jgi:hypothetical protein
MKCLEEIYRKMALQEFRRKRDQLALDSVRLGKIATVRTVSLLYYIIQTLLLLCMR